MASKKNIYFAIAIAGISSVARLPHAMADHQKVGAAINTIKLQDLIEEALKSNAALRVADEAAKGKEAQIGPAGSLDDPELSFEARDYPAFSYEGNAGGMREREVSLSQKIPFPGKRGHLREAASKSAEAQKDEAASRRLTIIQEVKKAYYELFVHYRMYDVLTDQQNLVSGLIATARKQYTLGKLPQADVLNLQLEEATIVSQLLTVEKQIKATLGEVNHLLGRTDHTQYLIGRPEALKRVPFKFDEESEAQIFQQALARNPKLSSKRALVAASSSKVAFEELNKWPDFDLKVGYTFRDNFTESSAPNTISAMVGVTLPLWAGSRQSEDRRRASAERAEAQATLDEEQVDTAHHVHVIYAEMEETSKKVQLFEDATLPLSKQALSAAQSGYLTGKVEFSTLLSLIQKRSQIELEYAEALATLQMKAAELEALTGSKMGDL